MQLVSVLAGAGRITQATDLARGLQAEWARLCAWAETRLETFAEQQRSVDTQLMPLRVLKALNDRLGRLLDRALETTLVEKAVRRSEPLAERLTAEREWELATREFHSSADTAEQVVRLQETAALQIDAAAYALDGLFDDLRGVMDVRGAATFSRIRPSIRSNTRTRSTLRPSRPRSPRLSGPALPSAIVARHKFVLGL